MDELIDNKNELLNEQIEAFLCHDDVLDTLYELQKYINETMLIKDKNLLG